MPPTVPSLLEYARHHGLAIDHRALDLDLAAHLTIAENDVADLSSPNAPSTPLTTEHKLKLTRSELQRLATTLRPPPPPPWDTFLPDRHRIRDLKLEIPMLVTDHEEDLRQFITRPSLDLKDLGVLQERTTSVTKTAREKLQVSKADLLYLQRILRDQHSREAYEQVLRDALPRYTRRRTINSLDDEETELEEDEDLQALEGRNGPISPENPWSGQILPSTSQKFSATQSLLSFMSTRGDKKLAFTKSHNLAATEMGGGTLP